jgi:hypothetical protein
MYLYKNLAMAHIGGRALGHMPCATDSGPDPIAGLEMGYQTLNYPLEFVTSL